MQGRRLGVACLAVLLTAADTYVVVLALPEIMRDVGLTTRELQRAAPIVTVFLLGYIAGLPLLGRLSDRYGRTPLLVACLAMFAVGSALTAVAPDLATVVVGRGLQGLGGGGLVPVTLALVADLYPADRRGVPLGVVGAVQELGAVLGPLYGAAVVSGSGWRLIFWLNLSAGAACALALRRLDPGRARDLPGWVLALLAGAAVLMAVARPAALTDSLRYGELFVPVATDSAWLAPITFLAAVAIAAFVVREATAARPLVPVRRLPAVATSADVAGGALLAAALGCVVVAFAQADPERQVVADSGPVLLAAGAVLVALFAWRERTVAEPLLPPALVTRRRAVGGLLVSLAVGAALIAALVDVPLFARATTYPDDQVGASLVLVRFLVALPVGALVGGALVRRVGPVLPTAGGMVLATVAFVAMTQWDREALDGPAATVALVVAGFGFGLAVAPVNAAVLAAVPADAHGIASALVVVARSIGMLVGLSVLTAVGMRRFNAGLEDLPGPDVLCPSSPTDCSAYSDGVRAAVLDQLHAIFAGAAISAGVAAALALLLAAPRSEKLKKLSPADD